MMKLIVYSLRGFQMNELEINRVYELEKLSMLLPQVGIATDHLIHAGMYARTIVIPKDVILTGALIKVATILIINGDVNVNGTRFTGYNVLAANKNRKQAFHALEDTSLTMIFRTDVDNVADAEEEFTEEASLLISRKDDSINHILITGE